MRKLIYTTTLALAVSGCGGGGTSTGATGTVGYALPREISAVPTDNTDTTTRLRQLRGMSAHVRALTRSVGDLPADSDYAQAIAGTYVEEPALEQFEIIEQILGAIAQTNYTLAENVGTGPYKAMVAWMDEMNGVEVKQLEPWVVRSDMIVENGQNVNRLRAWIEEADEANPGQTNTIKCEMKIYSAATVDTDGSIVDYGRWTMHVKFNESGSNYFVATADVENGMSVIKINEFEDWGGETHTLKGFLYRTGTQGYGKMQFTDYDSCTEWPCTPGLAEAVYAYNSGYLGVQKDSDPAVYKERDSDTYTKMTHRYGLYFSDSNTSLPTNISAGDSVMKNKQFGFPIAYTDDNGVTGHGYYGAWQGRHQLWAGDGDSGLSVGDDLVKENWGSGDTEGYTVGAIFNGSFTKRTYVDAALADIVKIPVETWIDKNYELFYNAGAWQYCDGGWIDWGGPTCTAFDGVTNLGFTNYTNFGELVVGEEDRKWVNINRWDGSQDVQYVYLAADDGNVTWTGAGFYPATQGQNGIVSQPGAAKYNPSNGHQLWVNVGGSIFIAYTGEFGGPTTTTGWVEKELVEFNTQTWQPVFGNTDTEFTPERGREYYMNSNGVNYVVKRVAEAGGTADDYEVLLEVQKTANPENCTATDCTTVLPGATSYLRTPWDPNVKYTLVTDSSSSNYLMLKYLTDDPNTNGVDESAVETVVSQGMWGLQAYNASDEPIDGNGSAVSVDDWGMPDGDTRPVEFNWEYCDPSQGHCWGAQTYLKDSSGNFVVLDDPINFSIASTVDLLDYKGDAVINKALMLQFDGWMHGLPDLYHDLSMNDWTMTDVIRNKIVSLPAGLEVDDGTYSYYVKPLETSIFLNEVLEATALASGLDISLGSALDLSTLPTFVDHGMGDTPTGVTTKYSEGVPVSELNP